MKKVFVFCIGGTGLRVMKSVTMLMAGGMSTNGYTVIPIIIDPHLGLQERGNLNNLLNCYQRNFSNIIQVPNGDGETMDPLNGFFNSEILRLHQLDQKTASFEDGSFGSQFKNYIETSKLSNTDVNQYLVRTLFSTKNLDNKLDEGFRGSPNVGTVVLGNMIEDSEWYQAFKRHCGSEDRAFIISSIFGGTGASGFPLMEKKIKQSDSDVIKNLTLGAVTVLPYYGLRDPKTSNSNIDSKNFYTKTKAALSYYHDHILSDYLYYIGETHQWAVYDNDESKQQDDANFIELTAASALFDFLKQPSNPDDQQYLSRCIQHDEDSLAIDDMGAGFKEIVKSVADLALLSYFTNQLPKEKFFPLSQEKGWNKDFYEDKSFKALKELNDIFEAWYSELSNNKRAFAPLRTADGVSSNWIADITLKAKNDSYYLLEMIDKGKCNVENGNIFRHFMQTIYHSINYYTQKINEVK